MLERNHLLTFKMAQQTHVTLPLFLFFGFGITIIDCTYPQMPTVETIPSGVIERTIEDQISITCRVKIYLRPRTAVLERVDADFREFFLVNCTGRRRIYWHHVGGSDVCGHYDPGTHSCIYEWTSEKYILNHEGDYEFGCMNHADEDSDGCEGVDLLRVIVSRPALPSTQMPSSTITVNPTVSSTITTSATTSFTSTAPGTTYLHTSYGDGGSSNSVTRSRYLTSNPVSTQPTVERRSKDAVNAVTGGSSASNSNSGRKGSQLTLIMPLVLCLFIVVMAALLAMFWKCRRRRSSESVV